MKTNNRFLDSLKNMPASYVLYFFSLLLLGILLSTIVPPMQAPDEPAHITRAYSLLKGKFLLTDHAPPHDSGIYMDDGLLQYMDNYVDIRFHPEVKVSKQMSQQGKNITWSSSETFSSARGASTYFPVAYLPQTLGFLTGKLFGLSVDQTYRLARFAVLISTILTLIAAFKIFPPNFLVLSLLLLPMTLFQNASASLDSFSTALAILCVSLFMRGVNSDSTFPKWMGIALPILIFILVTCRAHALPIVIFPCIIYFIRKKKAHLASFALTALSCLLWLFISGKMSNTPVRTDSAEMLGWWSQHPWELIKISINTITQNLGFYLSSFIGILGWLDTRFPSWFYGFGFAFLATMTVLSISAQQIRTDVTSRISLILASFGSVALIFLAMLLTWTPPNASVIEGVQGRYFLIPMILLAYSLSGTENVLKTKRATIAFPVFFAWFTIVATCMTQVLINRYYLTP